MTELDEVAKAIAESCREHWPLTPGKAKALAFANFPEESEQFWDNLADVIFELAKA